MKLLWQQIGSLQITDLLSKSTTLDGVVLDHEHGVFDPVLVSNCISLLDRAGKKSFVRLSHFDRYASRVALDSGVTGLIFSTVDSIEYVKKIRDWCLPHPHGKRGVGLVRSNDFGNSPLLGKKPILVAQVETIECIDLLCQLGDMDIFDYYMIGPYDLSVSIGDPGNFDSKNFKIYIKKIEEQVGVDRIGYHIVSDIKRQYEKYKKYNFLAFGLDTLAIKNHKEEIEELVSSV